MQHLQIFQPSAELTAITSTSNRIVDALSDGYRDIIQRMVGKTATTKKTYTRNVEHFVAFIQRHGITAHAFGEYREQLAAMEGISIKTKNAYLAAAAALLRESLKYGILPVDITANVPVFKVARRHVKDGLTSAEVRRVLEYIKGMERPSTRRKMAAMFYLFAMEGLRQMEVQQLRVEDVNVAEAYLMIRRKGADDKVKFYIMNSTTEAVAAYIDGEELNAGWLFPSSRNTGQPVTLRAIRKYFTCPEYGIFARCGISGKSVHGFRHFNITETLKAYNGNLEKTRQRSGHGGHEMLVVYNDERLNRDDVAELEERFTV